MTDPNEFGEIDPLIDMLRAADPVDQRSLPTSTDPTAAQLLEETLMNPSSPPLETTPTSPGRAPAAITTTPARAGSRRAAFLLAAAAAVVVLIAGVLVLTPENTTPALATVQSAARQTAAAESGRATAEFSIVGDDGSGVERLAGRLDAAFSGNDISIAVDVSDAPAEVLDQVGDGANAVEARLVDDVVYLHGPFDDWIAVEAPEFLGSELSGLVDPRSVLTTVQELVDTRELGRVDIDGVATTHYQSVVDLGDESLGQAGWLAGLETQVDLAVDGAATIDLFIDDQGVLRKLDVSGEAASAEGPSETVQFTVSTSFTDIGEPITIDAPEGVEVGSLLDSFGQDD